MNLENLYAICIISLELALIFSMHSFLVANNIDPKLYNMPDYLPILLDMEEILIAQVHIVMK